MPTFIPARGRTLHVAGVLTGWLFGQGELWLRDSSTAIATGLAASACDRLFGWLSQGVAAPPNGLDVILAAARVSELLSELANEDVNDLGFWLVVQAAVKLVEEHFLGQSRAYAESEECEHLVLLGREMQFLAVEFHISGLKVDDKIAYVDDRLGMAF